MDENTTPVVNETEVVDTSSTESTPVESESTGDEFDQIMSEELNSKDNQTDDQEETDTSEESEEPQEKASAADLRKEQLQTEIRDFVAQKNQAAQELQELQQKLSQAKTETQNPQDINGYLDQVNPDTGDYYTRQEAKTELLEKEIQRLNGERQQEQHLTAVRDSQAKLEREAQRVLAEFPQFDERSQEYNKDLAERMAPILEANLAIDPVTKQIVGTHLPVYELYETVFSSYQAGNLTGAKSQQNATSKMLRSVDTSSGAQNTNETSDEKKFIDGFFK